MHCLIQGSLGVKFEGGDPSLPTSTLLPGKKPGLPVGGAAAPLCCPQFLEASQAGSRFDSLGPTSSTSALPQPGTLTGWGGGAPGAQRPWAWPPEQALPPPEAAGVASLGAGHQIQEFSFSVYIGEFLNLKNSTLSPRVQAPGSKTVQPARWLVPLLVTWFVQ